MKDTNPQDIRERTFKFACAVVQLCRAAESRSYTDRVLSGQLLRAGTSIGANIEEAQAGQSRADFISKCLIALKEARETIYWLKLLSAQDKQVNGNYKELVKESSEIAKIIGAIVVSTRSRGAQ
jgi:four helix bundle protein